MNLVLLRISLLQTPLCHAFNLCSNRFNPAVNAFVFQLQLDVVVHIVERHPNWRALAPL